MVFLATHRSKRAIEYLPCNNKKKNSDKILSYVPEGVWYIIVSRYDDKYYSEFAEYLEQVEVLDYKTFELSSNLRAKSVLEIDAPKSLVVKIRK